MQNCYHLTFNHAHSLNPISYSSTVEGSIEELFKSSGVVALFYYFVSVCLLLTDPSPLNHVGSCHCRCRDNVVESVVVVGITSSSVVG